MGFRSHQIEYMKGHGVFSNLWSGVRKLASFLKPYAKEHGMKLLREHGPGLASSAAKAAVKHFTGGSSAKHTAKQYHVKFTAPQLRHIQEHSTGSGIFSGLLGMLGLGCKKGGKLPKAFPANIFTKRRCGGGNLLTLGSQK